MPLGAMMVGLSGLNRPAAYECLIQRPAAVNVNLLHCCCRGAITFMWRLHHSLALYCGFSFLGQMLQPPYLVEISQNLLQQQPQQTMQPEKSKLITCRSQTYRQAGMQTNWHSHKQTASQTYQESLGLHASEDSSARGADTRSQAVP